VGKCLLSIAASKENKLIQSYCFQMRKIKLFVLYIHTYIHMYILCQINFNYVIVTEATGSFDYILISPIVSISLWYSIGCDTYVCMYICAAYLKSD
jgi:hypothetical protein